MTGTNMRQPGFFVGPERHGKSMKIAFLIRSLDRGGAERQLVCLANGLATMGHQVAVMVFYGGGELESELDGVQLLDLKKAGRWDLPGFLARLAGCVRGYKPDILHGYLGTANALTVLLKPFMSRVPVVWGLRASDMDLSHYDWLSRWSFVLERNLSRFADLIIVNSRSGLDYARKKGFASENMQVVPNGVDTKLFKPDREAGKPLRAEWGVGDDEILVGLVARIDPIKDHQLFLKAAALLPERLPKARFVCVGGGDLAYLDKLKGSARELGLEDRLTWAGSRADMPVVYNSLDICCLSSQSEGFPNVLAEAMACGVPCVSTDVGDARHILGDSGVAVARRAPEELAEAVRETVERIRKEGVPDVRSRIVDNFSLDKMVERAEELLRATPEE